MLEDFDLNTLQANPKNPRTISKHDFDKLLQSIKRFGDLSGIVLNRTTNQLVGGHQRVQAFKQLGGQPKITERYDQPNSKGTVALGYVLLDDEKYAYREVQWEPNFEAAANVAANRIQGEFDTDLLAQLNYELSGLENGDELLALTGQTDKEIKKLLDGVSGDEDQDSDEDDSDKLIFRLTREQRELVEDAINMIVATREMAAEETGSKNGTALYYMARDYLDRERGLHPDQAQNQEAV